MIMSFFFNNHCFRPLLLFFITITILVLFQQHQQTSSSSFSSFVSAYRVNCGTGTTIIVEDLDLGTEPIIIDQCSNRRLTIRNVKTSQIQFKQHLRGADLHIHDITVISNRQGPLISFRWLVDMRGVRVERVHRIYDETAINLPSTQDEVILFDLTGGVNLRESYSGPGVIFQDNSIEIRGGNLGIGALKNRLSFALIRARGDGHFRGADNLIIRNNTIKMTNTYSHHHQQQQQGLVTNGDVDLHILDHEQTRFHNVKTFTFVDNKIIGMKTSQSIRALNMSLIRIGPSGVWDDLENLIFERNYLEVDVQSSSGGIAVSLFRASGRLSGVRNLLTQMLGTKISFEDNVINITRAVTRAGNVHLALVRFDDLLGAEGYMRQIHTFSVSNNLAVFQNVGITVDPSYSSSVKMNVLSLPKVMTFDNSFTQSNQQGRDLGGAFIVENNKMYVNTFRAKGSGDERACAGKVSIVGVLVASEEFHLWYSVQIRNLTIQPVSLFSSTSSTETAFNDNNNKISFVDSSLPYFNSATPSSVESCHSLLQIGVVWFQEDLTFIHGQISFRDLLVDFSRQQQEESSSSSSSSVSEVAARGREGYFDVFGVRFGKLANDDSESSGATKILVSGASGASSVFEIENIQLKFWRLWCRPDVELPSSSTTSALLLGVQFVHGNSSATAAESEQQQQVEIKWFEEFSIRNVGIRITSSSSMKNSTSILSSPLFSTNTVNLAVAGVDFSGITKVSGGSERRPMKRFDISQIELNLIPQKPNLTLSLENQQLPTIEFLSSSSSSSHNNPPRFIKFYNFRIGSYPISLFDNNVSQSFPKNIEGTRLTFITSMTFRDFVQNVGTVLMKLPDDKSSSTTTSTTTRKIVSSEAQIIAFDIVRGNCTVSEFIVDNVSGQQFHLHSNDDQNQNNKNNINDPSDIVHSSSSVAVSFQKDSRDYSAALFSGLEIVKVSNVNLSSVMFDNDHPPNQQRQNQHEIQSHLVLFHHNTTIEIETLKNLTLQDCFLDVRTITLNARKTSSSSSSSSSVSISAFSYLPNLVRFTLLENLREQRFGTKDIRPAIWIIFNNVNLLVHDDVNNSSSSSFSSSSSSSSSNTTTIIELAKFGHHQDQRKQLETTHEDRELTFPYNRELTFGGISVVNSTLKYHQSSPAELINSNSTSSINFVSFNRPQAIRIYRLFESVNCEMIVDVNRGQEKIISSSPELLLVAVPSSYFSVSFIDSRSELVMTGLFKVENASMNVVTSRNSSSSSSSSSSLSNNNKNLVNFLRFEQDFWQADTAQEVRFFVKNISVGVSLPNHQHQQHKQQEVINILEFGGKVLNNLQFQFEDINVDIKTSSSSSSSFSSSFVILQKGFDGLFGGFFVSRVNYSISFYSSSSFSSLEMHRSNSENNNNNNNSIKFIRIDGNISDVDRGILITDCDVSVSTLTKNNNSDKLNNNNIRNIKKVDEISFLSFSPDDCRYITPDLVFEGGESIYYWASSFVVDRNRMTVDNKNINIIDDAKNDISFIQWRKSISSSSSSATSFSGWTNVSISKNVVRISVESAQASQNSKFKFLSMHSSIYDIYDSFRAEGNRFEVLSDSSLLPSSTTSFAEFAGNDVVERIKKLLVSQNIVRFVHQSSTLLMINFFAFENYHRVSDIQILSVTKNDFTVVVVNGEKSLSQKNQSTATRILSGIAFSSVSTINNINSILISENKHQFDISSPSSSSSSTESLVVELFGLFSVLSNNDDEETKIGNISGKLEISNNSISKLRIVDTTVNNDNNNNNTQPQQLRISPLGIVGTSLLDGGTSSSLSNKKNYFQNISEILISNNDILPTTSDEEEKTHQLVVVVNSSLSSNLLFQLLGFIENSEFSSIGNFTVGNSFIGTDLTVSSSSSSLSFVGFFFLNQTSCRVENVEQLSISNISIKYKNRTDIIIPSSSSSMEGAVQVAVKAVVLPRLVNITSLNINNISMNSLEIEAHGKAATKSTSQINVSLFSVVSIENNIKTAIDNLRCRIHLEEGSTTMKSFSSVNVVEILDSIISNEDGVTMSNMDLDVISSSSSSIAVSINMISITNSVEDVATALLIENVSLLYESDNNSEPSFLSIARFGSPQKIIEQQKGVFDVGTFTLRNSQIISDYSSSILLLSFQNSKISTSSLLVENSFIRHQNSSTLSLKTGESIITDSFFFSLVSFVSSENDRSVNSSLMISNSSIELLSNQNSKSNTKAFASLLFFNESSSNFFTNALVSDSKLLVENVASSDVETSLITFSSSSETFEKQQPRTSTTTISVSNSEMKISTKTKSVRMLKTFVIDLSSSSPSSASSATTFKLENISCFVNASEILVPISTLSSLLEAQSTAVTSSSFVTTKNNLIHHSFFFMNNLTLINHITHDIPRFSPIQPSLRYRNIFSQTTAFSIIIDENENLIDNNSSARMIQIRNSHVLTYWDKISDSEKHRRLDRLAVTESKTSAFFLILTASTATSMNLAADDHILSLIFEENTLRTEIANVEDDDLVPHDKTATHSFYDSNLTTSFFLEKKNNPDAQQLSPSSSSVQRSAKTLSSSSSFQQQQHDFIFRNNDVSFFFKNISSGKKLFNVPPPLQDLSFWTSFGLISSSSSFFQLKNNNKRTRMILANNTISQYPENHVCSSSSSSAKCTFLRLEGKTAKISGEWYFLNNSMKLSNADEHDRSSNSNRRNYHHYSIIALDEDASSPFRSSSAVSPISTWFIFDGHNFYDNDENKNNLINRNKNKNAPPPQQLHRVEILSPSVQDLVSSSSSSSSTSRQSLISSLFKGLHIRLECNFWSLQVERQFFVMLNSIFFEDGRTVNNHHDRHPSLLKEEEKQLVDARCLPTLTESSTISESISENSPTKTAKFSSSHSKNSASLSHSFSPSQKPHHKKRLFTIPVEISAILTIGSSILNSPNSFRTSYKVQQIAQIANCFGEEDQGDDELAPEEEEYSVDANPTSMKIGVASDVNSSIRGALVGNFLLLYGGLAVGYGLVFVKCYVFGGDDEKTENEHDDEEEMKSSKKKNKKNKRNKKKKQQDHDDEKKTTKSNFSSSFHENLQKYKLPGIISPLSAVFGPIGAASIFALTTSRMDHDRRISVTDILLICFSIVWYYLIPFWGFRLIFNKLKNAVTVTPSTVKEYVERQERKKQKKLQELKEKKKSTNPDKKQETKEEYVRVEARRKEKPFFRQIVFPFLKMVFCCTCGNGHKNEATRYDEKYDTFNAQHKKMIHQSYHFGSQNNNRRKFTALEGLMTLPSRQSSSSSRRRQRNSYHNQAEDEDDENFSSSFQRHQRQHDDDYSTKDVQEKLQEEKYEKQKLDQFKTKIAKVYHYLCDPFVEWRESDFTEKWGMFFDPYYQLWFAGFDYFSAAFLGALGEIRCGTRSCCAGISVSALTFSILYFLAILVFDPFVNRFDSLAAPVGAFITLMVAIFVVLIQFTSEDLDFEKADEGNVEALFVFTYAGIVLGFIMLAKGAVDYYFFFKESVLDMGAMSPEEVEVLRRSKQQFDEENNIHDDEEENSLNERFLVNQKDDEENDNKINTKPLSVFELAPTLPPRKRKALQEEENLLSKYTRPDPALEQELLVMNGDDERAKKENSSNNHQKMTKDKNKKKKDADEDMMKPWQISHLKRKQERKEAKLLKKKQQQQQEQDEVLTTRIKIDEEKEKQHQHRHRSEDDYEEEEEEEEESFEEEELYSERSGSYYEEEEEEFFEEENEEEALYDEEHEEEINDEENDDDAETISGESLTESETARLLGFSSTART